MVADRLIGRAAESGAVDHALADLDGGRLAAVELVGEPGIGNTRLLAEPAARAEAGGALELQGSATEIELHWPFWVFVDALDEHVHGMPSPTLRGARRFACAGQGSRSGGTRRTRPRPDHGPCLCRTSRD